MASKEEIREALAKWQAELNASAAGFARVMEQLDAEDARQADDEAAQRPLNGGELIMALPQFRDGGISEWVVVVHVPDLHKPWVVAFTKDLNAPTWMYSFYYDGLDEAIVEGLKAANKLFPFHS